MVELNDEDNLKNDDIKTKEGMDYETNKGYILGTPFIRAFMVILDFHQNRIGFANKVKNYGAEITGPGAPSGQSIQPDNPTPVDPNPVQPVDPNPEQPDDPTPADPVGPITPDDPAIPDDHNDGGNAHPE